MKQNVYWVKKVLQMHLPEILNVFTTINHEFTFDIYVKIKKNVELNDISGQITELINRHIPLGFVSQVHSWNELNLLNKIDIFYLLKLRKHKLMARYFSPTYQQIIAIVRRLDPNITNWYFSDKAKEQILELYIGNDKKELPLLSKIKIQYTLWAITNSRLRKIKILPYKFSPVKKNKIDEKRKPTKNRNSIYSKISYKNFQSSKLNKLAHDDEEVAYKNLYKISKGNIPSSAFLKKSKQPSIFIDMIQKKPLDIASLLPFYDKIYILISQNDPPSLITKIPDNDFKELANTGTIVPVFTHALTKYPENYLEQILDNAKTYVLPRQLDMGIFCDIAYKNQTWLQFRKNPSLVGELKIALERMHRDINGGETITGDIELDKKIIKSTLLNLENEIESALFIEEIIWEKGFLATGWKGIGNVLNSVAEIIGKLPGKDNYNTGNNLKFFAVTSLPYIHISKILNSVYYPSGYYETDSLSTMGIEANVISDHFFQSSKVIANDLKISIPKGIRPIEYLNQLNPNDLSVIRNTLNVLLKYRLDGVDENIIQEKIEFINKELQNIKIESNSYNKYFVGLSVLGILSELGTFGSFPTYSTTISVIFNLLVHGTKINMIDGTIIGKLNDFIRAKLYKTDPSTIRLHTVRQKIN